MVVAASLTRADMDATAACARGPDATRWLAGWPIGSALVVWSDGATSRLTGRPQPCPSSSSSIPSSSTLGKVH